MKHKTSPEENSKAFATNSMLLLSIQKSGFGPKLGTMNFNESKGVRALLRAAQIFFPRLRQDFDMTLPSVQKKAKELTIISTQDVQEMFDKKNPIHARLEDDCSVAKAQMNPMILFLCLDHGVDSARYYTPMASPHANGRSLFTEHVETVCKSVLTSNASSTISSEDFSIAPYYVDVLNAEGVINPKATKQNAEECSETDVLDAGGTLNGNGTDEEVFHDSADVLDEEGTLKVTDTDKEDDPKKLDEEGTLEGTNTDREDDSKKKDRPIRYKCILNRDRYSHKGDILGRTAVSLTVEHLCIVYEQVSLSIVHSSSFNTGSCRVETPHTLPLSFIQFFGLTLSTAADGQDNWMDRPMNELTAEFFQFFDEWLTKYFGGLTSVDQWEQFYIHLVGKVSNLRLSDRSVAEGHHVITEIDTDNVLVPKVPDIFNLCRLMYHALTGLRIALPDGQHRIAGMVRLLTGYEIVFNGTGRPPRSFKYGNYVLSPREDPRVRVSKLLAKISIKATVRIFVPMRTADFETECERYSRVRTISQAKAKPRVLSDV